MLRYLIDAATFPETPSSRFLSSSPNAGDAGYAWGVIFGYGNLSSYGRVSSLHVRLVR